jgi:hypothetical protein
MPNHPIIDWEHHIALSMLLDSSNMPKSPKTPKPDEHRNNKANGSAFDSCPKILAAEIVHFPNTPDRQIELWLKLADSALRRRATRRKRLLQ